MQIVFAAKDLRMNSLLRQRPHGFWDLVAQKWPSELTVKAQLLRSVRSVGEKFREASVEMMHNTSLAYDSRSAGHAESDVRIVKEKVRTLICFASALHGVTIGEITCLTPMVCNIRSSKNMSRSHRGTRSRLPRRHVPWSEKVFYLEQSKRKVQVEAKSHEWIFLGIKDEFGKTVVGTWQTFGLVCAKRPIFIEIPDEDWKVGDEHRVGRLKLSLYGTRVAPRMGPPRARKTCCRWVSNKAEPDHVTFTKAGTLDWLYTVTTSW